ncbi:hypothetical protein [Mycolicibacterium frederiksbergense]|uniref:hypothetical protein n=1 Tax=Mycolicibacterium frederiksbergense TaxID=117567 RepID=UPI0024735E53|nr:hypothetical protein [Mycolicibacterium frederiksbergense]
MQSPNIVKRRGLPFRELLQRHELVSALQHPAIHRLPDRIDGVYRPLTYGLTVIGGVHAGVLSVMVTSWSVKVS